MSNSFLFHYYQELDALYHLIEEFSNAYPKIASRLSLDRKNTADPMLAHLFQLFALSNARLSHCLEDEYTFLSNTLLQTLHPATLSTIPAFSIAQFQPDEHKLTGKLAFEKHVLLKTSVEDKGDYYFRTCYPVTVLPIIIREAALISKPGIVPKVTQFNHAAAFLRIRLEGLQKKIHLAAIGLTSLRIFIHLPALLANTLYTLLFQHCIGITVNHCSMDTSPCVLPPLALQSVGFKPEETLLPHHEAVPFSYRLLMDFFISQEKFMFFDINFLGNALSQKCNNSGDSLEIIFYLTKTDSLLEKHLTAKTLLLNCTPIINLFEANTIPLDLDPSQQSYKLTPEAMGTKNPVKIHSINEVTVDLDNQYKQKLFSFFSLPSEKQTALSLPPYHIIYKKAWQTGDYLNTGIESFLYFRHPKDFFKHSRACKITAQVICTHTDFPSQMDSPVFTFLENKNDKISTIHCIKKITPPNNDVYTHSGKSWQVLSTLHLNHFSLTSDKIGLEALCYLLDAYITEPKMKEEIFSGLVGLQVFPITIRSQKKPYSSFCQGIKIRLEVDETQFKQIGLYLFISILAYFFSTYVSSSAYSLLEVFSVSGQLLYRGLPRPGEAAINGYQ